VVDVVVVVVAEEEFDSGGGLDLRLEADCEGVDLDTIAVGGGRSEREMV